jgi:hypothetical protein
VKQILDAIENMEAIVRDMRATWTGYAAEYAPLLAKFAALNPTSISLPCGFVVSANFAGDKHALTAIVRALRSEGWSTSAKPPKKGDNEWRPTFSKKAKDGKQLQVWLYFTSTACRRVEVGKKMVEVPVYETVCDEITLDRVDAGPAPEAAPAGPDPLDDTPF